ICKFAGLLQKGAYDLRLAAFAPRLTRIEQGIELVRELRGLPGERHRVRARILPLALELAAPFFVRPSNCRDYAASAGSSTRNSGYQRRKAEPNSWLSVLTRVCKSRWAPRLVHCIDCRFTNRLLSTALTVDSTKAVEILIPFRY